MKDYKRLTSEQDFNCRECVDGECQTPDVFCPYRCECERYNQLCNLEDKIESGEIDYVADKDKEISRLTAENDKLRARLENAVELKAKVGDKLYMPWVYDETYDIAKLEIIGIDFRKSEFVYITDLQSDNAYYLEKYKLGIFRNEDFDNIVFTDYDKAEIKLKAKLKEIGGAQE